MNRHTTNPIGGRSRKSARGAAVATALLLPLAACDLDRLLDVQDVEVVTPGALQGAAALPVILAGAQGDFQLAFGGSTAQEGQVNMSGLFADELHYTSTFPTRVEVDQRVIQITNSSMETIHRSLQRARASAARAAETFEEIAPEQIGRATALNLQGFTHILFAENYCSGVPFSRLTAGGDTEYGEPLTTQQMLERAVASFDAASQVATGGAAAHVQQANLARVGRARALLNLNRPEEAAAAARDVPTSFVQNVNHSENTARQNNAAFTFVYLERRWSVADRKGNNGLPFRSAEDPRVPQQRGTGGLAVGFDNSPLFLQQKYPDRSTPIVLASGVEARLIEAEAAMRAGDARWLQILNDLRAAPPTYYPAARFPGLAGLQPLTDPGNQAARVDLLFQERAFWMYLTSHRLGDMRRLVRQYNRPANTVFPWGEYGIWHPEKSGEYGADLNFPIPFDEQNNPQFQGCLDRNA